MRNKFAGQCFVCGCDVQIGAGYFQRNTVRPDIPRKWLTRCVKCVGKGNAPEAAGDDNE